MQLKKLAEKKFEQDKIYIGELEEKVSEGNEKFQKLYEELQIKLVHLKEIQSKSSDQEIQIDTLKSDQQRFQEKIAF